MVSKMVKGDNKKQEFSQSMYRDLAADYRNMVSRYEKKLETAGRDKESEVYAKTLLPIYEETVRAFNNSWTRDLAFLKELMEGHFSKSGYTVMDLSYFVTYNLDLNRPPIETVAEVIHTVEVNDPDMVGTVELVYGMGLFDVKENKVVVFPRVSVRKLYE